MKLFKAKMNDAKLWKNLLSAISKLIEEADFNANEEGIKLRAMDPSHVAMVDLEWAKIAFDEYQCDKPTTIRIDIKSMLKLLKRIKSDETLEMVFNEETKEIDFILKKKITKKFTMPTLTPAGEEVPTPKVEFNSRVKIAVGSFKEIMEDAQTVSDHVKLETTKDKLIVKASSELSRANIEVDKESEMLLELDVKENSVSTYNLNYLTEMVKSGSTLSETVTAEFSTNMPIKIEFDMSDKGRLFYFLAPRIEVE